jgi:anthranilate/para-aminobenzoate synthase component II
MGFTLIIDNYDSFTWNVYADVATLGGNPLVRRNDKITIEEIEVGRVGRPSGRAIGLVVMATRRRGDE